MGFHFALEKVLRVRRLREEQQRNLLLAANAQCERLRRQLAAMERDRLQRGALLSQQLTSGLRGAELRFEEDCRRQADLLRDHLLNQLQRVLRQAEQERTKYLRLRRDHRAIEALRDSARQRFECEERRREQLALDEAHLLFGRQAEHNLPSD